MVTILLEQILELLKGWLSSFTSWAENVATTLGLIEEQTEYIDDIYDDTEAIKTDTGNIATSNQLIVSNTQGINNRLQSIDPNVTAIKNNVGTISTNTGIAAAFSEDIATNTLNTLDKVTTIASDTTQMRANTNNIYTDVDEIKTLLRYFSAGLIMEEDSEGAIANFDTDLTDYLINCKCGFSTTKANNALTGVSSISVTRCGKNLFNDAIYSEANWTLQENGYYNGNARALFRSSRYSYENGGIKTSGVVTISFDLLRESGSMQVYCLYESDNSWTNLSGNISTEGHKTFTTNSNKNCIAIGLWTTVGQTSQAFSLKNFQVEISPIETAYEPYNGTTNLINLGGTYYGGELDACNGRLKVTHGYIASYNGETINEPWISSLDDYVPNTSPTTGAEVVYPLTSPFYVAVNNITIRTLKGVNNVYNDCDNTFVTYKETVKHYLDKQEG